MHIYENDEYEKMARLYSKIQKADAQNKISFFNKIIDFFEDNDDILG